VKRVAIADDHLIVRRGLRVILSEATDVASAAEIGSREELFRLLRTGAIDILVLDVAFAGDGLQVLREIRRLYPTLAVVVFSAQGNAPFAARALRAGASAYVQNETAPEELVRIIHSVANGDADLRQAVFEAIRRGREIGEKEPHELLSPRELEIFGYIARGRTVSAIARELNLSVKTVSTYRSRILGKMRFSTNVDIMRYVLRNGPL
jgi:DNA-binding NarL/FixJ family response regulator